VHEELTESSRVVFCSSVSKLFEAEVVGASNTEGFLFIDRSSWLL